MWGFLSGNSGAIFYRNPLLFLKKNNFISLLALFLFGFGYSLGSINIEGVEGLSVPIIAITS